MSKIRFRRHLSMPQLLSMAGRIFESIPDPVNHRGFTLRDCLLSGMAVFFLKLPSLLQFDLKTRGETDDPSVAFNLRTLFGVAKAPSDTCLRERLDRIDPSHLRPTFRSIFAKLQRAKVLEHFATLDGHYLLSLDGTGYYSSKRIHCSSCCVRNRRNGTRTYQHQMMGGALVHPDSKIVIPLAPEMITRQDGTNKNDCERNASKRFITQFRKEHRHLRTIVVEDALASNAPHVQHLRDNNIRFILGVKPGDHKFLFDWVGSHPDVRTHTRTERTGKGVTTHEFRWVHDVPLNEANIDFEVNFLHYTEIGPDDNRRTWSWVTDLPLSKERMMPMMRAGRARWKVENEQFSALKNVFGYNFEHNQGHGNQYLANVMATLCVLMFLVEQTVELCCSVHQGALKKQLRRKYLWEKIRMLFTLIHIRDWEHFYRLLSEPRQKIFSEAILQEP